MGRCPNLAHSQTAFAEQQLALIDSLRNYCSSIGAATERLVWLTAPANLVVVLDLRVTQLLQRIAQGAVANAQRNSGGTRVDIKIVERPVRLAITLEDSGRGLREAARRHAGVGLSNVRFRATEIDAAIEFTHRSAGGLRVSSTMLLCLCGA